MKETGWMWAMSEMAFGGDESGRYVPGCPLRAGASSLRRRFTTKRRTEQA